MKKTVIDCFTNAEKDERKGKKHKGLLITKPDQKKAEDYLAKAKLNLELCDLYKEKGFDYKLPEDGSIHCIIAHWLYWPSSASKAGARSALLRS